MLLSQLTEHFSWLMKYNYWDTYFPLSDGSTAKCDDLLIYQTQTHNLLSDRLLRDSLDFTFHESFEECIYIYSQKEAEIGSFHSPVREEDNVN